MSEPTKGSLERARRVLVSKHTMLGSNPDAPVEKICNCGWRGIGLMAHSQHKAEEDAKIAAAEFDAAIREARLEEAKWWHNAKNPNHICAEYVERRKAYTDPEELRECLRIVELEAGQ